MVKETIQKDLFGFFENWKERRKSPKENPKSYKRKIPYTNRKNVMIKNDRTEEAYRIIESKVNEMLTDKAGYDLEIAGVMCVLAIRIYKSCLTPQDYDDIMEAIFVSD